MSVSIGDLVQTIVDALTSWWGAVYASYGQVAWAIPFAIMCLIFGLCYIGSKVLVAFFKYGALFTFIVTLVVIFSAFTGWF